MTSVSCQIAKQKEMVDSLHVVLDRFNYLLFFLIMSPGKYIVPLNWVRKTEYQNFVVFWFGHFPGGRDCGLVFRMFVFCPSHFASCLK